MVYYDFYMYFDVHGEERDRLVEVIQEFSGADIEDLGDGISRIDYFHIDQNGTIWFDSRADSEEIEELITTITDAGFVCQNSETKRVAE